MPRRKTDDELAYLTAAMGAELDTVLVFNLLRTHNYLNPFINAELRQQNLTASQLNALLALRTAGADGLRMGQIGRRLVVTKSNVTGLVDRLERQGMVRRCEHRDRRATVVRLTDAGAALMEKVVPAHAERLAELTAGLTVAEKKTLTRLLSKLRRELRLRRGRSE